jgi:hypothetical protein
MSLTYFYVIGRQDMGRTHTPTGGPNRSPGDFLAAVRFRNGGKQLFRVRRALDLADARQMVMDELYGVRAIVIAPCQTSVETNDSTSPEAAPLPARSPAPSSRSE